MLLKKWLHKYCMFFHEMVRDVFMFALDWCRAINRFDVMGGVLDGDINVVVPFSETWRYSDMNCVTSWSCVVFFKKKAVFSRVS